MRIIRTLCLLAVFSLSNQSIIATNPDVFDGLIREKGGSSGVVSSQPFFNLKDLGCGGGGSEEDVLGTTMLPPVYGDAILEDEPKEERSEASVQEDGDKDKGGDANPSVGKDKEDIADEDGVKDKESVQEELVAKRLASFRSFGVLKSASHQSGTEDLEAKLKKAQEERDAALDELERERALKVTEESSKKGWLWKKGKPDQGKRAGMRRNTSSTVSVMGGLVEDDESQAKELEALKRQLEEIEKERDTAHTRIKELGGQDKEAQKRLKEMEAALEKANEENSKLKAQLSTGQEELETKKLRVEEVENEKLVLEEASRKMMEVAREEKEKAQKVNEQNLKVVQEAGAEIAELKAELDGKDRDIALLEGLLVDKNVELQEAQRESKGVIERELSFAKNALTIAQDEESEEGEQTEDGSTVSDDCEDYDGSVEQKEGADEKKVFEALSSRAQNMETVQDILDAQKEVVEGESEEKGSKENDSGEGKSEEGYKGSA